MKGKAGKMATNASASSRFVAIYDTLPTDVKQALVEKKLIPLLDEVGKGKRTRVIGSAAKMQRRHAGIPVLDLKSRRREVNNLLDELDRDAKRSFVKERSQRHNLLDQVIESLTSWLSDIWRLVYEHRVDFYPAHQCLAFVVNSLDQIGNGRSSCRCAITSMYIPITLKRRSGKKVKSWDVSGATRLEEVVLFIWRDLFLSLLAHGTEKQRSKIPEMLDDIEEVMGWSALERLIHGGRRGFGSDEDSSDAEPEPEDEEEREEDWTDEDSEIDDNLDDNNVNAHRPVSNQPASHWSHRISSRIWQFRRLVQEAMIRVFELAPSLRLYSAILGIKPKSGATSTKERLGGILRAIATGSADAFVAALDIYALENDTDALAALLKTHSYLLRTRDSATLMTAISVIAQNERYQSRGLEIIQREMLDTARAIRTAVVASFSRLELPENREELEQILKLRTQAPDRQARAEAWVDAVSTPGVATPNPMAFAAMMFGMPIMGMDGEDGDPLGYLDFDPGDPDMEDLREEFRPKLKQRFEGWATTAVTIKGGAGVLPNVYQEIIKMMPFLRAGDIVEDMVNKLADKPHKHFVCDGVDALAAFARVQRRKHALANAKRRALQAGFSAVPVAGPSTVPAPPGTPPPPLIHISELNRDETLPPSEMLSGLGTPPPPPAALSDIESDEDAADSPPLAPAAAAPAPVPAQPFFTIYAGMIPAPAPAYGGMDDVD